MSAMKHSASAASMDSMGSNRGMGASGSSFKLREAEEEDQGFTSRHLRRYAKFAYTWPWCLSIGIVAFTLLLTIIVGVTGVALTDESDYVSARVPSRTGIVGRCSGLDLAPYTIPSPLTLFRERNSELQAWFILKSTRVARMDAFLEATDRLGDNFEPPERSDPKMRWGYYITYKAHDGDMLTPANLDVVRKTETMLANLTGEYFKVSTRLASSHPGPCKQPLSLTSRRHAWRKGTLPSQPTHQLARPTRNSPPHCRTCASAAWAWRYSGGGSGRASRSGAC